MARRRLIRSLSIPITMASVAVPLSIALLVGWTLVVLQNASLTREVTENTLLLVLGAMAFIVIMGVLVTFSVFLAREVIEVRRQDSFIDSMTHELKSPLASLKLCLETLGRQELDEERREHLRRMMMEDVDRLYSLIEDVLQASRLIHDRVEVTLGRVDLRQIATDCAKASVARTRIPLDRIRIDIAPGSVFRTDRAALHVILKNLLDNALKYSPEGSPVDVRATVDGEVAVIDVHDRGIGIPRKHIKRVFQRFHRVPSEQVSARHGTGLGLFVVSSLVRNLGGRTEAHSPGPGHGSTMRVVLPAGALEEEGGAAEPATDASPATSDASQEC